MGAIEWTEASWNPIRAHYGPDSPISSRHPGKVGWHCEHVSEGCRNCYAETMNKRLGTGLEFKPGLNRGTRTLFLDEKRLLAALSWRNPRMIFVCSMTDLFAEFVPDAWIYRMFAVVALCPRHTFQVLTKRSRRMHDWASKCSADNADSVRIMLTDFHASGKWCEKIRWPLPNVWLGVSCEDQATADARIPDLLETPAAVRFVSCEPMLGPIDLQNLPKSTASSPEHGVVDRGGSYGGNLPNLPQSPKLDWVMCGGESGHGARPMHQDWARSLRDQCAARVPFFFKQWGEFLYETQSSGHAIELRHISALHQWPDGFASARVGKKRAGRLLDGREYNELPAIWWTPEYAAWRSRGRV